MTEVRQVIADQVDLIRQRFEEIAIDRHDAPPDVIRVGVRGAVRPAAVHQRDKGPDRVAREMRVADDLDRSSTQIAAHETSPRALNGRLPGMKGRHAPLGDGQSSGIDRANERGTERVCDLALVIGVKDDDVRAAALHERTGPFAAAERVRRVDRGGHDGLLR